MHRVDENLGRDVKAALEAFKAIEVPSFQAIPIERIIPTTLPIKPVQTPVFAYLSLLGILTCAALFFIPLLNKPAHRQIDGVPTSCLIQSVTGKNVEVRASKQSLEIRPAHAGMFLDEGSKIKTGEDSEAILRAGAEVNIAVSQNSELEMNSLRVVNDNLGKDYLFSLSEGRVHYEVNSKERPVSLNVVTPDTNIQVWGTEFEIVTKPKSGTHIGVFKGDVLITPKARGVEPFHVLAGFQTLVTGNKEVKPIIRPFSAGSYKSSPSELKNSSLQQASENSDGILSNEDNSNDGLAPIEQIFEDKNVSR